MATTINDKNAHKRDALIKFDAGPHKYTCKGESDYISVTTWNHSHFKPFDADAIIKKMMRDPIKWAKSPYYGKTPEQIKAGWDLNRDEAAAAGTEMHQLIERWASPPSPPSWVKTNKDLLEYNKELNEIVPEHYLQFVKDHPNLIPYRTEWMIFDEDVKIAGSIDMISVGYPPHPPLETSVAQGLNSSDKNSPQEGGVGGIPPGGVVGGETPQPLIIYDWKRCKEIKENNSFKEFALTECIKHLPDTNFWHYSLQLNTYKAILEAKYDKKVEAMYLVCLHPNLPTYQLLQVPDLSAEVAELFALRKKQILSEARISVKKDNNSNKSITDYFQKK
jgi:hypothetical protein